MWWRLWCAVCGMPLGALAGFAGFREPSTGSLLAAALAGSGFLVAAASLAARLRDDESQRGVHLAHACSLALLALPALALSRIGVAPGAAVWLGLCCALLALGLIRGARARHPLPVSRRLRSAVAVPVIGAALLLAFASGWAAWTGSEPRPDEQRAAAVYDLDAGVVTRPIPACRQQLGNWRIVARRGAHPRLGPGGGRLWFDARESDGTRQIQRLDRATGQIDCWTCGQPGHNRRPSPGPAGLFVVFDSDRDASVFDPTNTEIYRARTRTSGAPPLARRMTFGSGPDDHALLGPSPEVVAWSRRRHGRYEVVAASIGSGHGGAVLRDPGVLVSAGAAWVAPLAWSRDARSLLIARGNPYRSAPAVVVDPATLETRTLRAGVAGSAGGGFSADGGWLALVGGARARVVGLLPDALGFVLGPVGAADDGPRFRGTELATGEPGGRLSPIPLGETGTWGESTGVALTPDGTHAILGQRRQGPAGVRERLIELDLRCEASGKGERRVGK